jgi:alpha-L-fucosidase 2
LAQRLDNGSGQTGWSAVWAAMLLARFGEGNAAYEILEKLLRENIHDNLFGAHPPERFQIDASFGLTAAVCELLVQEIHGEIHLLPALPDALANGSLEGVRVHGGHTLSFGWAAGKPEWLTILPARDDVVTIYATGLEHMLPGVAENGGIRISLHAGETLMLGNRLVKNFH